MRQKLTIWFRLWQHFNVQKWKFRSVSSLLSVGLWICFCILFVKILSSSFPGLLDPCRRPSNHTDRHPLPPIGVAESPASQQPCKG